MEYEFLRGFGLLLAYFVGCASTALVIRKLFVIPREIFRKILHMILLGSIFTWVYGFDTWWLSAVACILFMAVVYPILVLAEKIPKYSDFLIERKAGEIKRSFLVVFSMFTLLICVCWGWLGETYLVLASVLAWGIGDAFAALIGKQFGRHYIEGKLVEGKKTIEGTLSMFGVSFVTVMIVLLANQAVQWHGYVPISLLTAGVCAVVELYTKGGMDTITCPLSAAAMLIPLIRLWEML